MSVRIRVRILAAAAALCLAGGVSATVALTAHAATPDCGSSCVDIFSALYGTNASPGDVLEAQGGGSGRLGQPVILARASAGNPAEDFQIDNRAPVAEYVEAGLMAVSLAPRYGCNQYSPFKPCAAGAANDDATEFQYTPDGAPSGWCIGVATTPSTDTTVTLQPCGVSGKTLWIVNPVTPYTLPANDPFPPSGPESPSCDESLFNGLAQLISGASTTASLPFALSKGFGAPLFTFALINGFKNQLWGADDGTIGDFGSC
jgi:hypothetical protein